MFSDTLSNTIYKENKPSAELVNKPIYKTIVFSKLGLLIRALSCICKTDCKYKKGEKITLQIRKRTASSTNELYTFGCSTCMSYTH